VEDGKVSKTCFRFVYPRTLRSNAGSTPSFAIYGRETYVEGFARLSLFADAANDMLLTRLIVIKLRRLRTTLTIANPVDATRPGLFKTFYRPRKVLPVSNAPLIEKTTTGSNDPVGLPVPYTVAKFTGVCFGCAYALSGCSSCSRALGRYRRASVLGRPSAS
jgi:hypothetical protein